MTTLREEIEAIIDDCKGQDYILNDDLDEVSCSYTDSYQASQRIMQLLKENGYLNENIQ